MMNHSTMRRRLRLRRLRSTCCLTMVRRVSIVQMLWALLFVWSSLAGDDTIVFARAEQSPSVECSLSMDTMTLTWDDEHSVFYLDSQYVNNENNKQIQEANPDIAEPMHGHVRRRRGLNNGDQELSTMTSTANETSTSTRRRVQVKACWCLQALNRPVEFCPANFDSCKVQHGWDGPVSCHNASKAANFLCGFWLMFLFWLAVLILLCLFSDFGASAREYVGRKRHRLGRVLCCNSHDADDDAAIDNALLEASLDHLLEYNEERAGVLFQNAVAREQRRRVELARQQMTDVHRRLHRQRHHRDASNRATQQPTTPEAQDTSNADEDSTPVIAKLMLKTKIFESDDAIDENDSDNEDDGMSSVSSSVSSSMALAMPCFTFPSRLVRGQSQASTGEMVTIEDTSSRTASSTADGAGQNQRRQRPRHGEENSQCAICLVPLQKGDLVGDIPCGHLFHKVCLKDWLQQKCRCPLCQRTDVATLSNTTTSSAPQQQETQPQLQEPAPTNFEDIQPHHLDIVSLATHSHGTAQWTSEVIRESESS